MAEKEENNTHTKTIPEFEVKNKNENSEQLGEHK